MHFVIDASRYAVNSLVITSISYTDNWARLEGGLVLPLCSGQMVYFIVCVSLLV